MPVIKGLFFDLDGTLVDTHRANFEAYRHALADVGVDITFDDFKRSIGHQARTFLPWYAPGLTEEAYAVISEHKAAYYADVVHLSRLNTQLVDFMRLMGNAQLVLVTSAKRRNAEAVLKYHNLTGDFQYIVTAEDVNHSKPAPDAYKLALRLTKLKADEAIAFEDSEVGQEAALAAGISVMMVDRFVL